MSEPILKVSWISCTEVPRAILFSSVMRRAQYNTSGMTLTSLKERKR